MLVIGFSSYNNFGVKYSTQLYVVEYHPPRDDKSQYSMKCYAISVFIVFIIRAKDICNLID